MEKQMMRFSLLTTESGRSSDSGSSNAAVIAFLSKKAKEIATGRGMIPIQGLRALVFTEVRSQLKSSADTLILNLITHSQNNVL